MDDTPPVIRHIEAYLGPVDPKAGLWGWNHADGTLLQVAAFRNGPVSGATTLCTLGLGHHEFCSTRGHVRQELLVAGWDRFAGERLAQLLPVAVRPDGHTALTPSQVLGPAGPLLPGSQLTAFICMEPHGYPGGLSVCRDTEPATEFVWLVPASAEEAEAVVAGDTRRVVDRWKRERVDLLDWHRAPK